MNESEFIKVPVAFDTQSKGVKAMILNMINMLVVKPQSGGAELFVPEPCHEPFKINFYNTLDSVNYNESWYYVNTIALNGWGGEIHCGSNVKRKRP